jgi:hypothetical protein
VAAEHWRALFASPEKPGVVSPTLTLGTSRITLDFFAYQAFFIFRAVLGLAYFPGSDIPSKYKL